MFKNIKETNDKYSINESGEVKNNITGKILKSHVNNKGYLYIDLRIEGKTKKFLIHRLVAMAFLDNPNNHPVVNHIDCNPLNCHVSNLESCTYSYNNKYAFEQGNKPLTKKQLEARKKPSTHLYKKVYQYDKEWNLIAEYDSVQEASEATGATKANISGCCLGRYGCKTAKGFRWSYEKK